MQTRFARTRYILACSSIKAMAQCQGTTRGGQRCKLTSTSTLCDDHGRFVGAPLAYGAPCCALHGRPFSAQLVKPEGRLLAFCIDFEATGINPTFDRVVELAATACVGPPDSPSPCFSTVVCVDATFLSDHGARAAEVHGISPEEVALGPGFACAWARFSEFVDGILNTIVATDSGSDDEGDEEPGLPRLADQRPTVVIVAHNGMKYDFTMLVSECERSGVPWQRLQQWLFVDTLHLFDAIPVDVGGCKKLQCVSRFCSGCDHGLAAHRALADTMVLRAVVEHLAQCLSVSLEELIRPFCQRLNVEMSARYLNALG